MRSLLELLFRNMRGILSLIFVVAGFGFLYILLFHIAPAANKDMIMLSSGIILGVITTIAAYFFGTSKDKSDGEKANIRTEAVQKETKIIESDPSIQLPEQPVIPPQST